MGSRNVKSKIDLYDLNSPIYNDMKKKYGKRIIAEGVTGGRRRTGGAGPTSRGWGASAADPPKGAPGATPAGGYLSASEQASGSRSTGRTDAHGAAHRTTPGMAGRLCPTSRAPPGGTKGRSGGQRPPLPGPPGLRQCGQPGPVIGGFSTARIQGHSPHHLCTRRYTPSPRSTSYHHRRLRLLARRSGPHEGPPVPVLLGETGQALTACSPSPPNLPARSGAAAPGGTAVVPVDAPSYWHRIALKTVSPPPKILTSSTMCFSRLREAGLSPRSNSGTNG
ncbi:collagen alpha-2(I) chain-like [Onychostoma macrolepis]|uniref:collagen alpha-2(I) chain-like n=1 Tax=Onychostoma macrolepis TaxID=369639 RepID=UPI002729ABCA|nr:collagen alpha-2(I) chain-like [Onychostoma macrolepis]